MRTLRQLLRLPPKPSAFSIFVTLTSFRMASIGSGQGTAQVSVGAAVTVTALAIFVMPLTVLVVPFVGTGVAGVPGVSGVVGGVTGGLTGGVILFRRAKRTLRKVTLPAASAALTLNK